MERTLAAELISKNLPAIYGYAFARLYDKSDAEDLAGEIVVQILASCEKLECDAAFHGFAWRIAENTLCAFIRKKERGLTCELPCEELLEASPSCEDEYIESVEAENELYLLRRELSLLARTNREVSVAYYVDGRTCREIASDMNLSVEMVKYHLFKTRKLLKEGIGMTRRLGEKSYNPGVFRLDFWGDWNHYNNLFKRKLPGSIMLAAYDVALTAEELSVELGVSMPYLEDELDILVGAGVLNRLGERYQTNLVILTDDYEMEFERSTEGYYSERSEAVFNIVHELLPAIRELDFTWRDRGDNELMWMALNIALLSGWGRAGTISPMNEPKPLPLGGNGWVFGCDNDYKHSHFGGVTMHTEPEDDSRAWFSAENYSVIKSCQHFEHWQFRDRMHLMISAICEDEIDNKNPALTALSTSLKNGEIGVQNGRLIANFPVFTESAYEKLLELLVTAARLVCEYMIEISDRAAKILESHVPASVRSQCGDIAKIHHRMDVMALLLEAMVDSGRLTVPDYRIPLCIFAVKREK